jgi:GT2 family glycosyltransferase
MIQQLTAVVFFCYNRPKKTKESLTKILEFKGALPVFVFSDGDQKRLSAKVIEVRNILDECKHDIETTVLRKKKPWFSSKRDLWNILCI